MVVLGNRHRHIQIFIATMSVNVRIVLICILILISILMIIRPLHFRTSYVHTFIRTTLSYTSTINLSIDTAVPCRCCTGTS